MVNRRVRLCLLLALTLAPAVAASASPAVRCTLTPDREALPAGSPQTVVIKVSLDAPAMPREGQRPPVNLSVVLDRSGSMAGDKIEKARQAALEGLRRLTARDLYSLVIYDHEVETLVPAQSAQATEWAETRIRGIFARGNTALFGAVSQGAAEVRKNLTGPYVQRVILLSDGLANVGPSSPDDLGRLGVALRKEGISVTTMGIGAGFNEDLMARLAERSDGNHYFVESAADLPRIFAAELGDVLNVVAQRIVVELECPKSIRPLRIIGREGTIRGNRVELRMNQLYGGQEKYALVEVQVPPSEPDTTLDLVQARCSYVNALTQTPERSSALVQVRFSASDAEVLRSVKPQVQEEVLVNEMAEARDRALDLYNAGQSEEAARALRSTGRVLRQKMDSLGLGELAPQAETLEQDAAEFEGERLDTLEKKAIRSESYRVRTQQQMY